MSAASFVARFPPEIVALVFAHLTLGQRAQCLCICRSWRAFLLGWSAMWHELSDSDGYDLPKVLAPHMRASSSSSSSGTPRYRIASLHIHATQRRKHKQVARLFGRHQDRCSIKSVHLHASMSRQCLRRLVRLDGVTQLTLDGVSSPAPADVFAIVLRECPNVARFVYHTAWTDPAATGTSPPPPPSWAFASHPKLRALDMYLHARVHRFPLDRLLAALPRLRSIRLNPYDFGHDGGVAHVLHALQRHVSLQAIRFSCCSDQDNSVGERMAQGLRLLHLQELCGIDDASVIPFLAQHHATLHSVALQFADGLTHLTAAALATLPFPALERISIGPLGAHSAHLAAFFRRATRLRQVRLFGVDALTDDVLDALGQHAPFLESLHLGYCTHLTLPGLLRFATTAKCSRRRSLKTLRLDLDDMSRPSCDDNVLAAIRKALPQLVYA